MPNAKTTKIAIKNNHKPYLKTTMTEATKATVYRVLQMITRLKSGHYRKNTLAKQLGVHEKTIGRYIALLTDIGYSMEEDDRNRLFLAEPDADQIAHHFEPLEIELLRQLLVSLPETQPLKQVLLHKVMLQSNLLTLADALTNVAISKITATLNEAMLKRQVILKSYMSSDGTVKDLRVEPLAFTNSMQISVYDVERQKIITPALDRIGAVDLLDTPQTYKGDADTQDIFGFSDMPAEFVHLELSPRAYSLMLREFPLSKPYLDKNTEGSYFFKGPILSYTGIGRFCLGLMGQLKVVENEGLRGFLRGKMADNGF
jgi:proteasome accessory factor C